jgi:hypothetical protein
MCGLRWGVSMLLTLLFLAFSSSSWADSHEKIWAANEKIRKKKTKGPGAAEIQRLL